jgi:hypothetical protein
MDMKPIQVNSHTSPRVSEKLIRILNESITIQKSFCLPIPSSPHPSFEWMANFFMDDTGLFGLIQFLMIAPSRSPPRMPFMTVLRNHVRAME